MLTSDSLNYTLWNVQIGAKDPSLAKSRFVAFEVKPGKTVSSFVVARAVDGH